MAIPGDIGETMLGISEKSLEIMQNVTIIIHSAATVRFDEPLRKAIRVNVAGTYETIQVAKRMKRLDCFVHISTYFSNPYLSFVESKMYPAPMEWWDSLKLLKSQVPDEILSALTRKYLKNFPNTYTFTKNLAENVVNDHRHLFPVLIARPSISLLSFFYYNFTEDLLL